MRLKKRPPARRHTSYVSVVPYTSVIGGQDPRQWRSRRLCSSQSTATGSHAAHQGREPVSRITIIAEIAKKRPRFKSCGDHCKIFTPHHSQAAKDQQDAAAAAAETPQGSHGEKSRAATGAG